LIATGFVEIVQSRMKAKNAGGTQDEGTSPTSTGVVGDDWYDLAYKALENVDPPPSK
jgi:hypothetical protein